MIYQVLGEFRIGGEGRFVRLPGGRSLILLAVLALNANKLMTKEKLIRAVWGDADGATVAQLHKRISELRKLLTDIGRGDDLITRAHVGYQLNVDPDGIDLLRFQSLLQRADAARDEHRPDDETRLRREAVYLWSGPHPLVNVPGDRLRADIRALEDSRCRAAAQLFERALAGGGGADVLDELAALFHDYPVDRRLCALVMIAAYRAGRPAEAVAAYEHHRETYEATVGRDVDRDLRKLYLAVGGDEPDRVDEASAPFVRASAARPAPVPLLPRQLPPDIHLIGRGELAAELSWLLARNADRPGRAAGVYVLSGAGGIGKTALGLRAAHKSAPHYPDGQLYATLRDTAGEPVAAGEILARFLRAFGVSNVPETDDERGALYRTLTADRRVLVVLDDAANGRQVTELIPGNPRCAVVVTCRQRLPEVSGVHHVGPLEPLRRPAADQLFAEVVQRSGIELADDDATVGRVVELCGGLPLALRIAGALRVRDHPRPTSALIERLERQGLDALSFGDLSVARTIGAGFERLSRSARRLLLGLGPLRLESLPAWTADALLGGDAPDPTAALSELSANSMIDAIGDEPRYRFHDLTREWAEQRARAADPGADATAARAYTALLTLVRHAHTSLYGGAFDVIHSDVPDWAAPTSLLDAIAADPLDWFEAERTNIRAAVEHAAALGLTAVCWDLAVSSHEFYTIRGYFDDWYATHVAALKECQRAGDPVGEGIVLTSLGQPALVSSRRHGLVSGPTELERAIALLDTAGEGHGLAIAQRTYANALRRGGHLTRPLALFAEARENYAASGDTPGSWQALRFLGQSHLDMGRYDDARRVLRQAVVEAEAIEDQRLLAQARYWFGQALLALGDLAAAGREFAAMREFFTEPSVGQAYARHGLGGVAAACGRHPEAEAELDAARALANAGDDAVLEGRVRLSLAALHRDRDEDAAETRELAEAATVFAGCGAAYLEIRALIALARAEIRRGDPAAADAAWARVDDLYAAADVPEVDRVGRDGA